MFCLRRTTSFVKVFAKSYAVRHPVLTMSNPNVIKVVDNIIKSEQDDREYRALQLSNQMKILLISDKSTDKSAATLDVHIGHLSDPENLPGLAHFCEHMLFLGTEKYPSENEYNKHLSEKGGSTNAFTSDDHTTYFFEVCADHLSSSLDRFAQFFLCPLFTESATEREVNAVNSEHEKNINSDVWRINQLEKLSSKETHAYRNFGTGNRETLFTIPRSKGIDIRNELLKFHSTWYSANMMVLAVLGKESLDDLQNMVVDLFAGVQNKNVTVPEWLDHPLGPEQLKVWTHIVPVKDLRKMEMTFPIPDLEKYYKTSPGHYLGHLIGHEGPGSILSELKEKGWVNMLVGGQRLGAKGFGFFVVNMELSEEGFDHIEEIATNVFEYLAMLRKEGPQEWIFREGQDLAAMTFRFKDKERSELYTYSLAANLHDYPMHEVISGCYLLEEYKPELIDMLLGKLVPDNMKITLVSKTFEATADLTEPWYGTSYSTQPISEELIEKWRNVLPNPKYRLPPKNEFIPTNFELANKQDDACGVPILIKDTPLSRIWFKQDNEFHLPKAILTFDITSPLAYLDPVHCNMTYILVQLFKDSLNEYAYAAELAGLGYNLASTKYGIHLNVKGYNDKQHILLDKIMEKLVTFKVDSKRFDVIKETYIRGLNNFQLEQPPKHAAYYIYLLLVEKAWSNVELLESVHDITADCVQNFIPQLLSRLHIEALIHGNLTRQNALDLSALVENRLQDSVHTKPLTASQLAHDREIQLLDGCHYIYECENSAHRSSCIEAYYQCGMQDARANVLLELVSQIIKEPCFNILRTIEQLGYIVMSSIRRSNGTQGIRFLVQSDRHPSYVDGRIEAFISSMEACIQDICDEEFACHKTALAAIRLEKPKKLSSLNAKYWSEISSQQYNFDRDNLEVAELKTVVKEEVLEFFKEYISREARKRHKLAVHVVSTASRPVNPDNCSETIDGLVQLSTPVQSSKIEDITNFKSQMGLFPLVQPFLNIKQLAAATKSKL